MFSTNVKRLILQLAMSIVEDEEDLSVDCLNSNEGWAHAEDKFPYEDIKTCLNFNY